MGNQITPHSIEAKIRSAVTKYYKESLGKGPDKTCVHIWENIIIMKFDDGLTPIEETLVVTEEGERMVLQIRDYLINDKSGKARQWLEQEFNNHIEYTCFRLNKDKKTLCLMMMFENNIV